jgi:hypothetical protein
MAGPSEIEGTLGISPQRDRLRDPGRFRAGEARQGQAKQANTLGDG